MNANDPSAILITNCNNDNLVGKVFLLDPNCINMPFHENFKIIDAKDEETYQKIKASAWIMELYSERDILTFCQAILNLPSPMDILSDIGEHLDEFI